MGRRSVKAWGVYAGSSSMVLFLFCCNLSFLLLKKVVGFWGKALSFSRLSKR